MSGPWAEWPHRRRAFSEAAAADALLALAGAVAPGGLDETPPGGGAHHATVVRWPGGAMDVSVWRDDAGPVLLAEATATGTAAEALTRAGAVLTAAGWTVTGRWHRHGSGWRAAVTRAGEAR